MPRGSSYLPRGSFRYSPMDELKRLARIYREDSFELLKLLVLVFCGMPQTIVALVVFVRGGGVGFLLGTLAGWVLVLSCYAYYVIFWLLGDGDFGD